MRSLRRDKRGIIYIWLVVILMFPFFAYLYFVLFGPTLQFIQMDMLLPNLPSQAIQVLNLWVNILGWFSMFVLFGALIWAVSNAQKRDS